MEGCWLIPAVINISGSVRGYRVKTKVTLLVFVLGVFSVQKIDGCSVCVSAFCVYVCT